MVNATCAQQIKMMGDDDDQKNDDQKNDDRRKDDQRKKTTK
jgi:hypothetical protein